MSRNAKIGLIVLVLVGALVGSQFLFHTTGDDIYYDKNPWAKRPTEAGGKTTPADKPADSGKPAHLPAPAGPEKAPVKIDVYMASGEDCHLPSIDLMNQSQRTFPNQLRVVYHDTKDPAVRAQADEFKMGCEVSFLIDGQRTFKVPGRGKYGLITLDGPPGHGSYVVEDFEYVLESALKEKGVKVETMKQKARQAGVKVQETEGGSPATDSAASQG